MLVKWIQRKRRRKVPFSFSGKGGVLLITGTAMVLISVFSDIKEPFLSGKPLAQPAPPSGTDIGCKLERVADGDTVTARCAGRLLRIRLMGIDAPEMGQKPWGERSRQSLQAHLPHSFTLMSHGEDVYHRTLGTLYADGEDINLWMISAGMAVAYDGKDTPPNYHAAEKEAKIGKLGIWSESGDQQNPRKWRRYHL